MAAAALGGVVALASGCPASSSEVRPPPDQFYYPTGMDIAPDQSMLFVANANGDLRYDSGTIAAVDLDRVDSLIGGWLSSGKAPGGKECDIDPLVPYTLVCNEDEAVVQGASVRIGNFATALKVQALDDPGTLRVFAAVRGDPSLTWVDWDVGDRDLSCGEVSDYPECDDEHRLTQLRDDPDLTSIPSEPFDLFVDSSQGFVAVTHLSTGTVSLADAPPDGSAPQLTDALGGLFAPNQLTNRAGAAGVAGRLPGSPDDRIYVTSRTEARVQTLEVVRPAGSYPVFLPAEHFFLDLIQPSTDGRGIAFSADGNRAYVVNRAPPMLQIIDTSTGDLGVPRNQFLAGVELCRQASNLAVVATERGERVYVACFQAGQVWSINPRGGTVDAIIDVGRGPHAVVASPDRHRLYVSNFLEDTVAVVDLTPGSATENRVVLRLGHPRQEGGDQ